MVKTQARKAAGEVEAQAAAAISRASPNDLHLPAQPAVDREFGGKQANLGGPAGKGAIIGHPYREQALPRLPTTDSRPAILDVRKLRNHSASRINATRRIPP